MSFDVLRDGDGDGREQSPLSMLLCAGTQADTAMSNRYGTTGAGQKAPFSQAFSDIHPLWLIVTGTAIVCEPNKLKYSADISMYTSVCFYLSQDQVKIDANSLDIPALHVYKIFTSLQRVLKIKNSILPLFLTVTIVIYPPLLGIISSARDVT